MTFLLAAEHLSKSYHPSGKQGLGIHNISFEIGEGECVGLVGESGSGKSTLARLLLAIERPDGGDARLDGVSLVRSKGAELRSLRRSIQIVFQDPTSSLNDRLPVWRSVMEPLDNYPDVEPPFLKEVRHSRRATALRLFEMVGLLGDHLDRFPHELSGGQRQRVAIARGIALGPRLLVCDEPTSSLDAVIQAQILGLLTQLRKRLGMACLFISHDLAAVYQMSDRIIVLKDGLVVDRFASGEIWSPLRHSYTKLLVSAAQ